MAPFPARFILALFALSKRGGSVRALKRIVALVYLLASAAVVGGAGLYVFGPYTDDISRLFDRFPLGSLVFFGVCLGIVGLGALVGFCRLFFSRREPDCVCPDGDASIEVSLAAIESCARMAAPGDDDIMIERVEGRILGGDRAGVRLMVEVIAFTDEGREALGARVRDRVTTACENMLGAPGVTVRVRFLPSKTTVQTVEVSGER